MSHNLPYPYILKPLSPEDGGGYLIEFPDLPGCMSDGETEEEAILMGKDAIKAWINTAKECDAKGTEKLPVPYPNQVIKKRY